MFAKMSEESQSDLFDDAYVLLTSMTLLRLTE